MTTINDIQSVNWQIALSGPGDIAEGLADIRQCLGVIMTTTRGTDPFRPTFGTDIWKYIDQPVTVAAPAIVKEILTAIQLWEPRVRVTKLLYTISGEKILFDMYVELLINGNSRILFEIDRMNARPTDDFTGRAFGRGFSFAFS